MFLILLQPHDPHISPAPPLARLPQRRLCQHLYTLRGDGGILSLPGAAHTASASAGEGTTFNIATASLERALRTGRSFMLYDRHNLDVTRTSEAAGGVGVACRLADLPTEVDCGEEVLCSTEVHVCAADSEGKVVELHRVCRPAGPYERLEDVSAEIAALWATPPGWPAKTTQEDHIPRRRRRMQVVSLPINGEGATATTKVLALAEKLLRAAAAGEGSVQWGTLFRVSPQTARPVQQLSSLALSTGSRWTTLGKRRGAARGSLVDKARRMIAAVLPIAKLPAQSRRGRPVGSFVKVGQGRHYAPKSSQCKSKSVRGRGRPSLCSGQSKSERSWSIGSGNCRGKLVTYPVTNRWNSSFLCRACTREQISVRTSPTERQSQPVKIMKDIMGADKLSREESPSQVLFAPAQMLRRWSLHGVDCTAAMQAAPEEEGQHGRVYPLHDTEGGGICSVSGGAGAALLLKRFKPTPFRSQRFCSFPPQPIEGGYDFCEKGNENMQARSEISEKSWAGLKSEDGVVAVAAAEVDKKASAVFSAEVVFKTEDEEDVTEEQLAPLEEMFHLLRCRGVAQV